MRLTWAILAIITFQLNAQSQFEAVFDQRFPSSELQEDFMVFKQGLEKLHPGLYRYTDKTAMDSLFSQMQNRVNVELTYQEFYLEICKLVAKIKCAHTIATPQLDVLNRIMKKGRFFPLGIFWEFDPLRAYVGGDLSSEANRRLGTRIRSINGQSIEAIYSMLIPYLPSDGDILTNKHSRLEIGLEFGLWYYLLIDQSQTYIVELEKVNGEIFSKTYEPVTPRQWVKNYKKFISQKDPEIRKLTDHYAAIERKNQSDPIRCEYLSEDIALLTVRNFESQEFKEIISDAFVKIKENGIQNLIVDVRYNGGGDDRLGRYLFTHLIKEPTKYFDSLYTNAGIVDTTFLFKHTDKHNEWWKQSSDLVYPLDDGRLATKPEANQGLLIQQPIDNGFKGNVYILMNGRSASTTAEFTAATHINKLATFIGEESGGAYNGGHGGDFVSLKLPNSGIAVEIPLTKYVMNNSEPRFIGRGTLPDYIIRSTLEDFLNLKDAQLEFALTLINKKKN